MTIISWQVCVYAVWLFIYVQFLMSTVLVYTNICICVVSKDVDTSKLNARCCSCAMVIMKLYVFFGRVFLESLYLIPVMPTRRHNNDIIEKVSKGEHFTCWLPHIYLTDSGIHQR